MSLLLTHLCYIYVSYEYMTSCFHGPLLNLVLISITQM